MVDLRLTARRDAKAARAFLRKAASASGCSDKAHTCRCVIREINYWYDPHFDGIRHIDRTWRNNLIESDHAAMKRLSGYRQGFRYLQSAKATMSGIETIRTIKRDHIHHEQPGAKGEIEFIRGLFEAAA